MGSTTAASKVLGVRGLLGATVDATPVESIKVGLYNDCYAVSICPCYSTLCCPYLRVGGRVLVFSRLSLGTPSSGVRTVCWNRRLVGAVWVW